MRIRREGMTLLELVVAMTLMATMAAAVTVVLRTGHDAWKAQRDDATRLMSANATVRHILRHVRQAQSVSTISKWNKKSGELTLLMPSGQQLIWTHDKSANQVLFGIGSAQSLLGTDISELRFAGYEADGTTRTDTPADIRSIHCQVSFELSRDIGSTRTVNCRTWLRSW